MGIRGPEFHGTGNIESVVEWYTSLKMEPPEVADSVTFETSLYSYSRKTLKTMRPWRGCGIKEWMSAQSDGIKSGAFCGGQS